MQLYKSACFYHTCQVPCKKPCAMPQATAHQGTETTHGCIQVDDSTKDQRKSMHELLWNHATQHITTKDYRTCIKFYTAALAYAEADAKPATAHQLARAHVAVQKLDRSAQHTL